MGPTTKTPERFSLGTSARGQHSLESFNLDGVQIARRKSRRREFPLRHIVYFLIAVLSFKIFLYLDMGGSAYGAKIEHLSQGSTFEKLAAHAMALDPVSHWLVDGLRFGNW